MRCFEFDLNNVLKICLLNCETLIPPRIHTERFAPEYIMYVMLDGELYLEESGKDIKLSPGDIYIFKKGDYQKPLKCTYCKYYYIHFETTYFNEYEMTDEEYYRAVSEKRVEFLKKNTIGSDCYNYMKVILRQKNKIENNVFLKYCVSILANNTFLYEYCDMEKRINISNAFSNLLLKLETISVERLNKSNHRESSRTYNTALKIAEYIRKNYMHDISGKDIEREFFLNFDYANRTFKKIMGCNIIKYRNFLRIESAKEIMNITEQSLDEITEEVGFQDKGYFIRTFKKFEGMTPGKYRDQIMLEKRMMKEK